MVARRHSFTAPRTPPNAKINKQLLSREVRTVSPNFERARMAFRASPSPFGGTAGTSSNSLIQQGPELEEISTEVSQLWLAANSFDADYLKGPWLSSDSRRNQITVTTVPVAHRLPPSPYRFLTIHSAKERSSSSRWARVSNRCRH